VFANLFGASIFMRKGAVTRERILDAAAELLNSHGLAGATTRQIAHAAGLTEAALYRHFAGRDDLLGCVFAERMPQFIEVIMDLPNQVGQGTVGETLERVARVGLRYYAEVLPMLAPLFADPSLLARQQLLMQRTRRGPHLAIEGLGAYLRAEQEAGRVAVDVNPEAAARLLLGACFQHGFFRKFVGDAVGGMPEDELAAQLVGALVRPLT
jgi:AcrR family transcriptional regulator